MELRMESRCTNYTLYPKRIIKRIFFISLGWVGLYVLFIFLSFILSSPTDLPGNFRNLIYYFADIFLLLPPLLLNIAPSMMQAVNSVLRHTVYLDRSGVHLLNFFRRQTIRLPDIKMINARVIYDSKGTPLQVIEIATVDGFFQLLMKDYAQVNLTYMLQYLRTYAPEAEFNDAAQKLAEDDWTEYDGQRREEALKSLRRSLVLAASLLIIAVSALAVRHCLIEEKISNYLANQQTKIYSPDKIAGLEAEAAEIGKLNNVAAAKRAGVIFQLGDAYSSQREFAAAKDMYRQGLVYISTNTEYQFKLAVLELKSNEEEQAVARLHNIIRAYGPAEYKKAAEKLLASSGNGMAATGNIETPGMYERTVYVVSFVSDQTQYYLAVAQKIQEEYKVSVKLVNEVIALVETNKREVAGSRYGTQYSAEELLGALLDKYAALLQRSDTVGVIGLIPLDIYAADSNFVFSLTNKTHGVGIINCKRLSESTDDPTKRIRIQALSVTGHLLQLPRCTNAECAKAYTRSLGEQDGKPDTLCDDCRKMLVDLYGLGGMVDNLEE